MKRWQKIAFTSLIIVTSVLLLANFGLNFWLKQNLPSYIKNNSDYKVSYATMTVDLGTGNINATDIKVITKNPENQNIIAIDGNIDSLYVSRLGIWDALVNKKINSSNLNLINPNLTVKLAKPIDDRTGKKRNPVGFKNIKIKNGNITLLRHTKQKFLSVNDLSLKVSNLKLTEKDVEDKLPVVFDDYSIAGKNFYFRPDNVYALKANTITTENGQMSIKNFQLIPLLSYAQFQRFYPKKRNLFDFKTETMDFKDIVLKNNKVSLSQVKFVNPDLKMFSSNTKTEQKEKSFKYEVNLEDVLMNNAKIQILKANGNKLFSAGSLNMNVKKFAMDEESAKGNIPFSYEKFLIAGKELNYITDYQDIKVNSLAVNEKSLESRGIVMTPLVSNAGKPLFDFTLNRAYATLNHWQLKNNKLKLDVENVVLDALKGKFTAPENDNRKKMSLRQFDFPLKVKNITLKNSNIVVDRPEKPLSFNNLYANIQNLEMNEETVKKGIPIKVGSYTFSTKNFHYKTKFYTFTAGLMKFQKDNFVMNNFVMKPNYSRAQFIRMIPVEKDLYDIKINQVTGNGSWDFVSDKKFLNASNVVVKGVNANIFRSKLPKDDPSIKPMYSELLRKINFPMLVKNLDIKNSVLVYEEDTKQSDGPGKLVFGNFNLNAKNLNSGKGGNPTQIPIAINCRFMNVSPMNIKWNMDTANMSDAFSISGNISDLPASSINPFVEPYLKIRTTGYISDLIFAYRGNKSGLNGTFSMKHQNLKVSILKKTGEKNQLLSAVANMIVRTNSRGYAENTTVNNVQRDPTKSFFNLFWQGTQQGLKKILIGENVEKTEASVKNTLDVTSKTVKDAKTDLKNAAESVKEKAANSKEKVQETKDNLNEKKKTVGEKFRNIFKKKEKAEN